ncbi:MAG: DUF6089 family protein [Bacteroidales bacterium]|nr:DUF6089 family protein [Bacteroidales bacterium]MDP2236259.1 DUF6089 family protein [Bacteroidales bacterium]
MHKKPFILLFLLSLAFSGSAQMLETGLFGGVTYYNGDLNPGVPYNTPKQAFGFIARYSEGTRWAFRMSFTTGVLASDGKFSRVNTVSNASFEKNISDLGVVAEFNFLDYFTGSEKTYATPYIFGGFSIFAAQEGGFSQSLSFNQISFPFGVGFKYSLTERLGLTVEWKMHKTFTDDIDNTMALQAIADGDPLDPTIYGRPFDDIGVSDWFNFSGVTLTYKFNLEKKHKCNTFDNHVYR